MCSAFHFSVSWILEMQFGVIYFKTTGTTQPYVGFSTHIFCCFFVFGRTHGTKFSYTAWAGVCRVLGQVFLVGSWMRLVFLHLAVWGWGTLPTSCIRSLIYVSRECRCVNFEPQDARMMKRLRMIRSRRWKNSFFVHFQVFLLTE
jgi:hypothetical protein